jgi:hypothetical protein
MRSRGRDGFGCKNLAGSPESGKSQLG